MPKKKPKSPKSLYSKESEFLTEWLREQREFKELSLRDLEEILWWDNSIINRIEQGERRIDVIEFIWLCNALDVNPAEGILHIQKMTKDSKR